MEYLTLFYRLHQRVPPNEIYGEFEIKVAKYCFQKSDGEDGRTDGRWVSVVAAAVTAVGVDRLAARTALTKAQCRRKDPM